MVAFNTGVTVLIGWKGGRGGEWIRGKGRLFKVKQTELGSSKECAMGDKKCCYMGGAERKYAEIPPLT